MIEALEQLMAESDYRAKGWYVAWNNGRYEAYVRMEEKKGPIGEGDTMEEAIEEAIKLWREQSA